MKAENTTTKTNQERRPKAVILFLIIAIVCLASCMAACSPEVNSGAETGKADSNLGENAVAVSGPWSVDSNCAACHTLEAQSADEQTCLYSVHATQSCVDCHNDISNTEGASSLEEVHADYTSDGAKVPKRLKSTNVSIDTCTLSCHNIDDITLATADYQGFADKNGLVINPHTMLLDEYHTVGGVTGADINCSDCHEMHASDGLNEENVLAAAEKTCGGCHHTGVYECGTCHSIE